MDSLLRVVDKVGEIYTDYKKGRNVRLGTYKGSANIKQLGHYDASGKLLGIYHQ